MKKFLALMLLCAAISSCTSSKVLDVKSPCVSNDGGPCGPRHPVNDWWLKDHKYQS